MWNNSGTSVVHQQQMNDHGTDMGKQTNQQRVKEQHRRQYTGQENRQREEAESKIWHPNTQTTAVATSNDSLFVTVFFMGFVDTNENIYLMSMADLCLSFICSDNSWNSKLIQKITISYSFYIYFYIIGCTRPCGSAVSSLAETRLHPDPMTCNSTVTLTHPKQRRHVFLLWVQLQRTHSGAQAVFSSAAQQGQRLPHHPVHDLFRDIWQN